MKRFTIFTFATVLATAGVATAAEDLFEDKVLVKGKDFQITQSELDQAYIQNKAELTARGRTIPEAARPMVEKQMIDLLILKKLLLKKVSAADQAEAVRLVEAQIEQAPEGSLESRARLLGLTKEQFKQELIDQNAATRVVEREFKPKVVVTDEMCRTFYNEIQARFDLPEMIRAAHILFLTKTQEGQPLAADEVKEKRALAEKVLERARKGEDFGALAKEFSEDPGSKDAGGEYKFPRGQMVPEFEKVAFSQPPGTISDLVVTDFGFHIIKTLEKLPAQLQEFSESEPLIKDHLGRLELQRLLQEFAEKARKEPSLEILDERFKS
jgi:peptidyl-prolyl cis-trans isomerase C